MSLLSAPARAQAALQPPVRVDSGAVLRVTTHDGAIVQGPLVSWSPVGVTLGDGTSPVSFRLADLRAMKVRSVSRRPGRGALIGLATGLAVSLIGAALVCEKQAGNKENYCGLGFVLGPPVFGAMGTIAGAVIGTFVHGESWKPVQFAPP